MSIASLSSSSLVIKPATHAGSGGSASRPYRKILCLDGGGSRGVITLAFLRRIERITGKSIYQLFDLIVGTSTGSIIATMIALPSPEDPREPRYKNVDEMLQAYMSKIPIIFSCSYYHRLTSLWGLIGPVYSNHGLKTALEDICQDTHMSQMLNEILITTTATSPTVAYVEFTRKKARSDSLVWDQKVSDVVMCSTAAPTYFPDYKLQMDRQEITFIDGGISSNSPILAGISEAISLFGINSGPYCVLSIGTGYEDMDYGSCSGGGIVHWVGPICTNMLIGASSYSRYQTEKLLKPGKTYFRLDIPLKSQYSYLDTIDPSCLNMLITLVDTYVDVNYEAFMNICSVFA